MSSASRLLLIPKAFNETINECRCHVLIDWFVFIFANLSVRGIQTNPQGWSVIQPVTDTSKQHLGENITRWEGRMERGGACKWF